MSRYISVNLWFFLLPLPAVAVALMAMLFGSQNLVSAQGLTYVDALDGSNLGPDEAIDIFDQSIAAGTDNLWSIRASAPSNAFGASGSIYETFPTEDAPELTQTISGLNSATSYDIYAVWWSATGSQNWLLRAGLTSNPGGNTIYDRTGTIGTPGNLGVFANWTSPPADNTAIVDDFPGLEAATLEGDRVMLVAQVGTATPNASGEIEVFLDDTIIGTGPGTRTWLDGVAYAPAGANSNNVTATIDRTTGNLTVTSTANYLISAVNITSAAGALDPTEWSPITGNLDNGGGLDVDAWEITSMTANSLAENEVDRDADPNVLLIDGGTLGPGGVATLDFGDVWISSSFEDIIVSVTLNGSQFSVPITPNYTGGSQIARGDFDNDGDLDVDDYAVVLRGLNQDLTGMTDLQSYALGDVTGNQMTNFNDLVAFRDLYDAANGPGALAAALGGNPVPEPSSVLLFGLGALALIAMRRSGFARVSGVVALLLVACVFAPRAEAQITYIDADLSQSPSSNVSISGGAALANNAAGGWNTRGAGAVLTEDTNAAADGSNFGNNGNILQAGTLSEVDELAIDFTIPTAGLYDIYAFYWDTTGDQLWNVAAGFNSGALTDYNQNSLGSFEVTAETQVSGGLQEVIGLNVLGQGTDDYSDFVDGNRTLWGSKIGTQTVADNGAVTVFIDHFPAGKTGEKRSFFDGVGYAPTPPTLTLEVNTTTGEVRILNTFDDPIDLSYYEIRSPEGALNPGSWNSLDDQNIDAVDGLDEGTDAGDSLLEGWDEAGPIGGAADGDYNNDFVVDAADYTVWRDALGSSIALPNEAATPGVVTTEDYDVWKANFGSTGGGSGGAGTADLLNETFFLGTTTLAANSSTSLGNAFTPGGAQNLTFTYGLVDDGSLNAGFVTYVTSGSLAGAGQVPEPSTLALVAVAGWGGLCWRRRLG